MKQKPSRLPDTGTSIFTVMSALAQQHGAINLSQGFPDFSVSAELVDLICENLRAGHNQYAPMAGALPLRESIAAVVESTYGRTVSAETEITVTAGGTEAIFSVIAALVSAGDEVILFDPSYDSYDPAIRLNGGIPVHINLLPPEFAVDWDQAEQCITPRTRLIMINTPHNPTGAVLRDHDLKRLEQIAEKHDLIVLSDEVYERIIFDGITHQSVLRYPALAARSAAVFSFGKTFHATGWKVGYAVAPEGLTREIRKAHQFITFSVNTPVQLALAAYLKEASHYSELGAFYQQKRDFFKRLLEKSPFRALPCSGSYFQLAVYEGTRGDREMAEWLTRERGLASIPISVFYRDNTDNQLLRFCFAKREETLEHAGKILQKL